MMIHKEIPLVDLSQQNKPFKEDIYNQIEQIIDQSSYIHGATVKQFEQAFADYCGVRYCVAVNSGTSALHLAMRCLDINSGDEVITVSMSFVATAWPILYLNAKPVFADIDKHRYTLDPACLKSAITSKTKVIIPVHLYGQAADMDEINYIAGSYGLPVIEDACQAAGASYKYRKAGSLGVIGCFSFYPTKNLGGIGEGGAVVTNSEEFSDRLRVLRDHAQINRYIHNSIGYNYRMDSLQAAVLNIKLQHLDQWIAERQNIAARYDSLLKDTEIVLPKKYNDALHSYYLYVIRSKDRDRILSSLNIQGIHCGVHYPKPIHLQDPFKHHFTSRLNNTEDLSATCLSLPIYPGLEEDSVDYIADSIRKLL